MRETDWTCQRGVFPKFLNLLESDNFFTQQFKSQPYVSAECHQSVYPLFCTNACVREFGWHLFGYLYPSIQIKVPDSEKTSQINKILPIFRVSFQHTFPIEQVRWLWNKRTSHDKEGLIIRDCAQGEGKVILTQPVNDKMRSRYYHTDKLKIKFLSRDGSLVQQALEVEPVVGTTRGAKISIVVRKDHVMASTLVVSLTLLVVHGRAFQFIVYLFIQWDYSITVNGSISAFRRYLELS